MPLTNRFISDSLKELRDGINMECESFFPELFSKNLDASLKLKNVIDAKLDTLIESTDTARENLLRQRKGLCLYINVKSFVGEENAEIAYEKAFEGLCNIMNTETNVDVRTLTAKEFFSMQLYIRNKYRKK